MALFNKLFFSSPTTSTSEASNSLAATVSSLSHQPGTASLANTIVGSLSGTTSAATGTYSRQSNKQRSNHNQSLPSKNYLTLTGGQADRQTGTIYSRILRRIFDTHAFSHGRRFDPKFVYALLFIRFKSGINEVIKLIEQQFNDAEFIIKKKSHDFFDSFDLFVRM
ncbi:hypothetical protein GQX74_003126 [Glossina fuscipes]|nr:hypothetical protein GQX74_003126 [Glossina fuscipes]